MNKEKPTIEKLLESLEERAKELNCLYTIEELLRDPDTPLDVVCKGIIETIPPGWQYSDICVAYLTLEDQDYCSVDFKRTEWLLSAEIEVQDIVIGKLEVFYTKERPGADYGPFLKEEKKLAETIADRLGHFALHQRMKRAVQEFDSVREDLARQKRPEWGVILDMLRQTDQNLYYSISYKMLNYLCWSGIEGAEQLRRSAGSGDLVQEEESIGEVNQPGTIHPLQFSDELSKKTFEIAYEHLHDQDILARIQKWIQEDKLSFLVQVVNRNLPLAEVADAIRRYHHLVDLDSDIHSPNKKGVEVSLIRRFLSSQLSYINVAKNFIEVADFYHLLKRVMFSSESHGRLGGKSAGLYIASQILKKSKESSDLLDNVKVPRTWYITSDMVLQFMHYNNFDEIVEQKYKEINQVRLEYPYIVQTFKNSQLPSEMVQGLSVALDDFKDTPLIVRSSSLLEDSVGAAFSGKYKSLFVPNQGSKKERLRQLTDAIAEVYASTFGPDPIEYRAERGLLDFGEEMGIMIQEVVGTKVGKYFLPTFAGVAFSRNEFRWSPRIKRDDGLIRMVPGLGTRAVDRVSDDYPILIAPGQPDLRVNVSVDETVRYSPHMLDVINLETRSFETVAVKELLKDYGDEIPAINRIVSILQDGQVKLPTGLGIDFEKDDCVVTFEGLLTQTKFIKQMQTILELLEDTLGVPVDIEFASDGEDFYLLQCRPQSYAADSLPAAIPKDVEQEKVIFTADRYISNGIVDDITHIVYVDPLEYAKISDRNELLAVGRAVGALNKVLPKHQFILMGPGRWGSRGDIKLGVNVTYSDINNTAVLIEIARKKGNYLPDLSFGTHFFQDLVEANIRYLPLYPDDERIVFNEAFFRKSPNILGEVVPQFASLAGTIKLIDVPKTTEGMVLRLLMNSDLDEAVAIIAAPGMEKSAVEVEVRPGLRPHENYWKWRIGMAERIAADIDPDRFGVVALYVFGSTKNGTAGPGSDIDLLVHFRGTDAQQERLNEWLEGWSLCLAEMNYLRTGYRTDGLLDVHLVTDEDITNRDSYASKINAVTDAARPLSISRKQTAD